MDGEVFVSYARDDQELVRSLHDALTEAGFSTWYDKGIVGGQAWWDTILDHIEACGVFMPVLSAAYQGSKACRLEADYAIALAKPIRPVRIDESVNGTHFAPAIAETQWQAYSGAPQDVFGIIAALHRSPSAVPTGLAVPRPGVPLSYLVEIEDRLASRDVLARDAQHVLLDDIIAASGEHTPAEIRQLLARFRQRSDLVVVVQERIDMYTAKLEPPQTGYRVDPAVLKEQERRRAEEERAARVEAERKAAAARAATEEEQRAAKARAAQAEAAQQRSRYVPPPPPPPPVVPSRGWAAYREAFKAYKWWGKVLYCWFLFVSIIWIAAGFAMVGDDKNSDRPWEGTYDWGDALVVVALGLASLVILFFVLRSKARKRAAR